MQKEKAKKKNKKEQLCHFDKFVLFGRRKYSLTKSDICSVLLFGNDFDYKEHMHKTVFLKCFIGNKVLYYKTFYDSYQIFSALASCFAAAKQAVCKQYGCVDLESAVEAGMTSAGQMVRYTEREAPAEIAEKKCPVD